MRYRIKQVHCRPWLLNGHSLKLIESYRICGMRVLYDAETIAGSAMWVGDRIAALGVRLPKLGLKH